MSKRAILVVILGLMIALMLSAGCVALPAATGSTGAVSTLPVSTALPVSPASTPTAGVVAATAEVSTSLPPSTSGPLGTETLAPAPTTEGAAGQGQSRQITLDDDGKTVTLRPGERVLLYLGEGYNWDVAIADQEVISRVPGVLTIRGSQGLFEAHQEGTTMMSATGDPACRQSQPPCAMPSRAFGVRIVVNAGS